VQHRLIKKGIFIGPILDASQTGCDNCILIAVTEKRTRDDLDRLIEALTEILE